MYLGQIMEIGRICEIISHPRHPYTRALIQAVPIPDPHFKGAENLPLKSMQLGSLENRGDGCPFIDRCLYQNENCKNKCYMCDCGTSKVMCTNLESVPSTPIYDIDEKYK